MKNDIRYRNDKVKVERFFNAEEGKNMLAVHARGFNFKIDERPELTKLLNREGPTYFLGQVIINNFHIKKKITEKEYSDETN